MVRGPYYSSYPLIGFTAGTIRNETVTFLQNVSVSLRKSSSVSASLHFGTRTLPGVTDLLRSCVLHFENFAKKPKPKKYHLLHKTCKHIKKGVGAMIRRS